MNNYKKYGPYIIIIASLVLLALNISEFYSEEEYTPIYGIISNVLLILAMVVTIRSGARKSEE